MNDNEILNLRKNIISIGRLLWEKELVSGINGNISVRLDEGRILITASQTCLGLLKETDILLATIEGEALEEGVISNEKLLHTSIYKNFVDTQAVIHTHTPYANGYFLEQKSLQSRIFECRVYLGEVKGIEQNTPAVTDVAPVLEALKVNSIVALRNHGVVSMGKNLFDCFLLVQCLEDAAKVDAISKLYSCNVQRTTNNDTSHVGRSTSHEKKYKLFSQEQIDEIVRLVNDDAALKDLGAKTQMTMVLAVKLDETGQVYGFHFENGQIVNVDNNEDSEFLISAPESIWRAVFNQEIDPFVATTQKKMNLRGDFAKISKWYAPCSRIFELWTEVPVE